MKKLFVPLIFILFIVSCKKFNPEGTTSTSLIVGKWYYTQDTIKQYKNTVLLSTNFTGGLNLNHMDYEQFNSDGTGSASYNNNITNFTYSVNNNIISFKEPGQNIVTETGIIKTLTTNRLNIFYDDTSTDINNNAIRVIENAYLSK